jgi:hypothetical protein
MIMNRSTRLFAAFVAVLFCGAIANDALARGRMYHPELGRFMQRDPLGTALARPMVISASTARNVSDARFTQRDHAPPKAIPAVQYADGMNLYQYVRSNPLNRRDANGLFSDFRDCCPCQVEALKADHARAQQQIRDLKNAIQQALNAEDRDDPYPPFTAMKLRQSIRKLDSAARALENATARCRNKEAGGQPYAWTTPWGRVVRIYPSYWRIKEEAQAATVVHEGTHMGAATTDVAYFWTNDRPPRDVGLTGFDSIASTYDTWILTGFCIPKVNCLETVTYDERRGETECPDDIIRR